jgi:hypothetical protein
MAATTEGWVMKKKYIVRLTDVERATLDGIVKKLKGPSVRVRRAQVLLKADADGPGWKDAEIAEAYSCRRQTVENIRERFVTEGFEVAVNGRPREPRAKLLDGAQEAKVIAMRLGPPPAGFANWSLRLLAERVVELAVAETISYETVRRTLKKTA